MNFSMTYGGVIVTVLGTIFAKFGLPYTDQQLSEVFGTLVFLVGVVQTLYGRYRTGGISALGFKQ